MMAADLLYVGDGGSDVVQQFNAETGAYVRSVLTGSANGLRGPRGIVVQGTDLLVVNQNVGTQDSGEVLRFNLQSGTARTPLVPAQDIQAPFSPSGMVVRDNVVFVADTRDDGVSSGGRIAMYNATTGQFLRDLVPTGFNGEFRPRGLVFGPDGGLYVTVFSQASFSSAVPGGYILRFDTANGATRVIAFNNGDQRTDVGEAAGLHNPGGLVFDPDGEKIYVVSNRTDVQTSIDENTHLLIIDPDSGIQLNDIELKTDSNKTTTRVFAQSVIFGPTGKLYIPVAQTSFSGNPVFGGFDSVLGSVWTYAPATNAMAIFIESSPLDPVLEFPEYLTFGRTEPGTLNYEAAAIVPVAPVLSGVEITPLSYAVNASKTIVSKTINVTDADSAILTGASVRIITNYQIGQDVLSLGGPPGAIQTTWNASSGTLTLSGNATAAKYQGALRCILFESTSSNQIQRSIEFRVSDGVLGSNAARRDIRVVAAASSQPNLGTNPVPSNSVPVASPQNNAPQSTNLLSIFPIAAAASSNNDSYFSSNDWFESPGLPDEFDELADDSVSRQVQFASIVSAATANAPWTIATKTIEPETMRESTVENPFSEPNGAFAQYSIVQPISFDLR